MNLIRVLLSTDYPMMRDGLRILLNASGRYEVCGDAADGRQTLRLAMQLNPDILILDISMPPPNGLEVAAALRRMLPNIKILVITMDDSEEVLRAVAAGAAGYLLKSDGEEDLILALESLENGQSFMSPAFCAELAKQLFEARDLPDDPATRLVGRNRRLSNDLPALNGLREQCGTDGAEPLRWRGKCRMVGPSNRHSRMRWSKRP